MSLKLRKNKIVKWPTTFAIATDGGKFNTQKAQLHFLVPTKKQLEALMKRTGEEQLQKLKERQAEKDAKQYQNDVEDLMEDAMEGLLQDGAKIVMLKQYIVGWNPDHMLDENDQPMEFSEDNLDLWLSEGFFINGAWEGLSLLMNPDKGALRKN